MPPTESQRLAPACSKPMKSTRILRTTAATKIRSEYFRQILKSSLEATIMATVPKRRPRTIWEKAMLPKFELCLAKRPREAEEKMKKPATRSVIVMERNSRSIFAREDIHEL